MIEKIINYLVYQLHKIQKPELIGGFNRHDNVYLDGVGISNTSHISFKQNLHIENNVFIGHFNYIDCRKKTTIEEGVQITNYVSILNHSSHNAIRFHGSEKRQENYTEKLVNIGAVFIGKFSFIGPHSVIMPNTTIGEGSIVSAYSFVKGTFPPFSIIKGNPAVVVGDTREIDSKLLAEFPELKAYYYQK